MKNFILFILLIIVTFSSCEKDEPKPEQISPSTFNIDGKQLEFLDKNVQSSLICSGFLVSAILTQNNVTTTIYFTLLSNGQLAKMEYNALDFSIKDVLNSKYFYTPAFSPTSTFTISNFSYNGASQLSFDYDGTLTSVDNDTITKTLKGRITSTISNNYTCTAPYPSIEYNTDKFKFNSIDYDLVKKVDNAIEKYTYTYGSNNGYLLKINLDKDLWELPLDTFAIDPSSMKNINLEKYIGAVTTNNTYLAPDWQKYESQGNFRIISKYYDLGKKVIIGTINVNFIKDNIVVFQAKDMVFKAIAHN